MMDYIVMMTPGELCGKALQQCMLVEVLGHHERQVSFLSLTVSGVSGAVLELRTCSLQRHGFSWSSDGGGREHCLRGLNNKYIV